MINSEQIKRLSLLLDQEDIDRLKSSAKKADEIEYRYKQEMNKYFHYLNSWLTQSIMANHELPDLNNVDFTKIIASHSFETMTISLQVAYNESELKHHSVKGKINLSKGGLPSSFSDLMGLWDKYRNKKIIPARVKKIANGIKKAYIKKVQSVWQRYAKDFIAGDSADKEAIMQRVMDASSANYARAKTIVETETTYYYNKTRKEYYDKSEDVTHYLFVTIRDSATTEWCGSRRGLVYTKGTAILNEETPPIHWNCRSEILPLTKQNPKHLRLIEDDSLRRENHKCKPLPIGWTGRQAA